MSVSRLVVSVAAACCLSACSYEAIRMQERQKCGAMPQSLAERCYERTRMTRIEYEAERAKLEREEAAKARREGGDRDPRYERWIP